MNEFENVEKGINVGVNEVPIQIPVRVIVTYPVNTAASFEFTTSIDDLGQIVLTPTSKDAAFITANTSANINYDTDIMTMPEVITESENIVKKEMSILIDSTMLVEEHATTSVSADVDEIGQCVLYPINKNNIFITASVNNSLNLITEALEMYDYCDGYKILNPGGCWYVKDSSARLIGQGFKSLNDAKIFVCETEIKRLSNLTEETVESEETTKSTEYTTKEPEVPTDVKAEVINEAVVPEFEKKDEFNYNEIEQALIELTNTYTEQEGGVRCDTSYEQKTCYDLLKQHYAKVDLDTDGSKFTVTYSIPVENSVNESVDSDNKMNILLRFLQGDVTLVSDPQGQPLESYIYLTSDNGLDYYYDPETDSIGTYKKA